MTSAQLFESIKRAKQVALFCHANPDPDAYGSVFALKEICNKLGTDAKVFAFKNPKGYLDDIFPLEELQTDFDYTKFDLVIVCDFHILSRTDKPFIEGIEKSKNVVVIDHHQILPNEVVVSGKKIIKADKAANCQLVCDLLQTAKIKPSAQCATYLWAGLIGDTGRFLHSNLSEDVLKTAIFLMKSGAEVQKVYDAMYRKTTRKQLRLRKDYIDKMTFLENDQIAYVIYTLKDLKRLGIDKEDVKKYVGDMIAVEGVVGSFLAIEYSKNHYKLSMRTSGLNAFSVAEKMGGGGHICAAGFEIDCTEKQLKKHMRTWAKELLDAK